MRASRRCSTSSSSDASVNTLFVATFTYGRGIAGRQVPGQPLPDHGKQEYDTASHFQGGSYTKMHPQYYKDTVLQDFRAPDFGDYDVLEAVIPVGAQARHEDHLLVRRRLEPTDVPNIEQAQEKQLRRQQRHHALLQQSQLPQLAAGHGGGLRPLLRDRRHHVGLGAAGRVRQRAGREPRRHGGDVGAHHLLLRVSASARPGRAASTSAAPARDSRRSATSCSAARSGKRPVDGYYVTLWRLMLRYPELLAWEMLWTDSLRETYAAIYDKVKSIKPSVGVGWHIWHNNSFNPIYRAEQDLVGAHQVLRLPEDGDVPQLRRRAHGRATSAASAAPSTAMSRSRNCSTSTTACWTTSRRRTWPRFRKAGFSADYVYREAKRAREALNGTKTQLWPGIDIDIPDRRRPQQVARPKARATRCWRPSAPAPTACCSRASTPR